MAKGIWETLADAAREGKTVQVTLPAGARIRRPKRPSGGRPTIPRTARFGHYAGYDPETGSRPRCCHRGCSRWLRKDQVVACSPGHERAAIEAARRLLGRCGFTTNLEATVDSAGQEVRLEIRRGVHQTSDIVTLSETQVDQIVALRKRRPK